MRKSRNGSRVAGRSSWAFAVLCVAVGTLSAQQAAAPADSTAFYRGLEQESAGNYREAATLFRTSLHTSSGVSAILGLERAYAELHWPDSLLAPVDSLIAENPREPVYRTVQLRTLETLGRHTDVQLAFERWARASPTDPVPYREYARLLLQRGAAVSADSVLALARQRLGGVDQLQYEVAQTEAAMGHWDASARAWRAALATMPYLEQAAAYALAPAPAPVRDSIRTWFFAPPVLLSARRALATLEAAWGTAANGWLALRDLEPDSASAAAWLDFAQRAESEERWTQARDALASVLRWRRTPDVELRAAIAALNSGDPAGALALAPLTTTELDSAQLAHTMLPVHIRALAQLGRPATAEQLVSAFQRWLTPAQQTALGRSIAFGWVRVGDMSRARSALAAAGAGSDSSEAGGWLALYAGDLRTARRLLRSSGDASPELARALALLARVTTDSEPVLGKAFVTLARGDTLHAIAAMLESTERLPEAASLLLYIAADLQHARGDDAQAIPLWKRVVEQYASSAEAPESDLVWARAARRRGDATTATQRLEHLILTYPQSALVPQARRDLEQLRNTVPQP
jgi:tetratricopeptide (TPR) repeat protein